MPRDPERIEGVLAALHMLWTKYPDLRFGQLVKFITQNWDPLAEQDDAFYVEDDQWLRAIMDILENGDDI